MYRTGVRYRKPKLTSRYTYYVQTLIYIQASSQKDHVILVVYYTSVTDLSHLFNIDFNTAPTATGAALK
jgi:hypothetical protein